MKPYHKSFEVIWADIDPNRHMRHTVYNDYAAQARVGMFADSGLPMDRIAKLGLGPILFREETRFLKEVSLSDIITVTCAVRAMRRDGSRWTITHDIFRGGESKADDAEENNTTTNKIKAAVITVEGAWIDLESRRLGSPPPEMQETLENFPRTDDFEWLD